MPAAYSIDLRERVLLACKKGKKSHREIAEQFSIGLRTLQEWVELKNETGSLKPRRLSKPGRACTLDDEKLAFISVEVKKKPDILIAALIEKIQKKYHTKVSQSMVSRGLKKLDFRRKKKSLYAQEQEREDVKKNALPGKKKSCR